MDNDPERIHETLGELHDQLGSLDTIDDELRSELEVAIGDIRVALESKPDSADGDSELELSERLRKTLARFENDHPTIAHTIQSTVDLLAAMGI